MFIGGVKTAYKIGYGLYDNFRGRFDSGYSNKKFLCVAGPEVVGRIYNAGEYSWNRARAPGQQVTGQPAQAPLCIQIQLPVGSHIEIPGGGRIVYQPAGPSPNISS